MEIRPEKAPKRRHVNVTKANANLLRSNIAKIVRKCKGYLVQVPEGVGRRSPPTLSGQETPNNANMLPNGTKLTFNNPDPQSKTGFFLLLVLFSFFLFRYFAGFASHVDFRTLRDTYPGLPVWMNRTNKQNVRVAYLLGNKGGRAWN